MKIKPLLLSLLLLTAAFSVSAQNLGGIKGTVVSRTDRQPIDQVKITLNTTQERVVYTTNQGNFEITDVPEGMWELLFEAPDFISVKLSVKVANRTTELNFVTMSAEVQTSDAETFLEFEGESDSNSQDLPTTLSSRKDVFESITGYNFGSMRFRARGYENSTADVYMNGVYMNDAQSGYGPFSLWGGLNDATRNQESSSALEISDYGVGSINGTVNVNATASQLRKGFRASAVNSSGQYLLRFMATYASGENDKGWSYALSASTRQGGNFWVKGVNYNAWAYYASLEKRFGDHRLALTAFGAPVVRSVQAAATQETFDLVGSNYYNSNWGYQGGVYSEDGRKIEGGQMRSARERDNHEPVVMLNYTWDIDKSNKLMVSASYRFGRNGYSALDWYDAQDPRPDYYRYLPSYFSDAANADNNDPDKAGWVAMGWQTDWNIRQINWDALYNINRGNVDDGALRSKYVVEDRRADQNDLNFKAQFNSALSNNFKLATGIEYRWNQTEYFKTIKDLLGGEYWLDIDQFGERDFGMGDEIQNDLNNPNRKVKEGDKYGYDYYSKLQNERVWATLRYHSGQWEGFLGVKGGHTRFWRDGLFRKGLFPDNSYGSSEKQDFWTYSAKAGATYKITGNHTIYGNIGYFTNAPYFQNAMVSPRTRNDFLPGLTTEKTFSADFNYSMRLPFAKMRLSGYYTTIQDQVDVISFYDDYYRTFTNFAMQGIDQRHIGMELGLEIPIVYEIVFKGALSLGRYVYTSDPTVTHTADNNARILGDNEIVHWTDYKISGTPQTAISVGLDYRSPNNLFLGLNLNYFDNNYISMNPLRRTDMALFNYDGTTRLIKDARTAEENAAMVHQERFPSALVLNASIGKFWYVGKYMIGGNLSLNNILNNTNIKSGGYEQMRNRSTIDNSGTKDFHYEAFDSKYYYLFGFNYYLNLYIRF